MSGSAWLRSDAAACGQPTVSSMLQQPVSMCRQMRLSAACACAVRREVALVACGGGMFRAACAAVALRVRRTRAGRASAWTHHAFRLCVCPVCLLAIVCPPIPPLFFPSLYVGFCSSLYCVCRLALAVFINGNQPFQPGTHNTAGGGLVLGSYV